MTTAPAMPDFAKTVNAVVIRSSVLFERPVLNLNEIKPSVRLKINRNNPCNYATACVSCGCENEIRTSKTKHGKQQHRRAWLRRLLNDHMGTPRHCGSIERPSGSKRLQEDDAEPRHLLLRSIRALPSVGGGSVKKRDQTIRHIVACIAIYDDHAPKSEIESSVSALDPESIGVLHGISGVLRHAVSSKMPAKWIAQIHGDLMEAFKCLSNIANENN